MGNQVNTGSRHVYNYTGKDLQLYHISARGSGLSTSAVSQNLTEETFCSDPQMLIGTLPSGASKTLSLSSSESFVVIVCDGIGSIRSVPDSKDLVIELDETVQHGVKVCPFSSHHHVALPSILMNLDALLNQFPPLQDSKNALNRTISTTVSSPRSTPSLTPKNAAPSSAARGACLIASIVRSWRSSDRLIAVTRTFHASDPRALVVVRRREYDDCLLVVGGLAVYIGAIDTDWVDKEASVELDASSPVEMLQGDLYCKVVAAAMASLGCVSDFPSCSEVMSLVGRGQTDMSKLLSGAIVLNHLRDNAPGETCPLPPGLSRTVSQAIGLAATTIQ